MTQDEALGVLKTGANVFLTGEPGSGKTHTINRYIEHLRGCGIEPAITASTGIAATHVGGMTIHSWSGIGVREQLSPYDLDSIAGNKRIVQRITGVRVLVIDEVSMLSAQVLSMVEQVCRSVRRTREPFGGLQVILVGDFFQLPPVVARGWQPEMSVESQVDMFEADQPPHLFAFGSPAWRSANPLVCYLGEQHRTEDAAFLSFLSAVRSGIAGTDERALLRTRYKKVGVAREVTQLFTRNASVDYINTAALKELPGQPTVFTMESRGRDNAVASLKRGCLSPETLSLKVGARVMFTKNDYTTHKFVNGTTGVVAGFDRTSGFPLVKKNTGQIISAEPMEWTIQDDGRVIATISQVPLRLAWAITVHKSQGMSLSEAHLDLSDCFEYGQGYVALSRVRTLAGLTIAGLNERALEVHPQIAQEDARFREASDLVRERFAQVAGGELEAMHLNFIKACGGKPGAGRTVGAKKSKRPSFMLTRELIGQKLSIDEIAARRELAAGTIIEHLERLAEKKLIVPADDLAHLCADVKRLAAMREAFDELYAKTQEYRLAPVREMLGDDYGYDELRLARLLFGYVA